MEPVSKLCVGRAIAKSVNPVDKFFGNGRPCRFDWSVGGASRAPTCPCRTEREAIIYGTRGFDLEAPGFFKMLEAACA